MTAEKQLKSIENYLERERKILRTGQIAGLTTLTEDRAQALSLLNSVRGKGPELQRLKANFQRNNSMLSSAAAGLRSAIKRISELRAAAGPIGSYSASGERREIGSNAPTIERKA